PDPKPDPKPDPIPTPPPAPTPDPTPDPAPTPDPTPTPASDLLSFALVNADTNQVLAGYGNLGKGSSLNLDGLNLDKYNLVARVNPGNAQSSLVKSVKFTSKELGNRIESVAPYALFGDVSGNFFGRVPKTGEFTIKATAYTAAGAKGKAISSSDVTYQVIDQPATGAPVPTTQPKNPFVPAPSKGDRITLTASKDVLQPGQLLQTWGSGVKLSGTNLDGKSAQVGYDPNGKGFGIAGAGGRSKQIDFSQSKGNKSESLKVAFGGLVNNVELTLASMYTNEGGAGLDETGKWTAFDAKGVKVADGLLGPDQSTLGADVSVKGAPNSYPIAIKTAKSFASLSIEATGFSHGQGDGVAKANGENNSDFSLAAVSFDPVLSAAQPVAI
ncbi:MAG: hypothetical protein AAFP03_12515, partial [Cyanobacteria bacterium J06598_3]